MAEVDADTTSESPAESFRVSKEAEVEWLERNAFYYQRKDSTKLFLNHHTTNSQRFSNLKSNPSIMGLPKTHKTPYARRPESTTLFPGELLVGVDSGLVDPSSPNVSCIGRVRSTRKLRHRQRSKRSTEAIPKVEHKKKGFFQSFRAVFSPRVTRHPPNGPNGVDESLPVSLKREDIRDRLPPTHKSYV